MSATYLEDGRPENSVSLSDIGREGNGNTYQTLLPSSSRSQLIPSTAGARTTEGYLHAHDSCHSHHSNDCSHRLCRNRRTHRTIPDKRFSRSGSIRCSEDLKHLYLKIKLGFSVICLINILVVVFCILTNPKFDIFPDDDRQDFLNTGEARPKTFKLCTKCQPLEAKVGTADGLVQQIRSSKYPEFCCFRRVDQLLRLVDWYSKTYLRQEKDIIKESYPANDDTTNPVRQPVFAHLYFKDTETLQTKDKDAKLTWETTGISLQKSHIGVTHNNSVLVIEETGYYYMYSHLVFMKTDNENEYRHTISLTGLKDNGMAEKVKTKSVIQGIYKLQKGNELSVTASYNMLVREGRLNYFSLHKL